MNCKSEHKMNIVFCKVKYYIRSRVLYRDRFENVLIYILFCRFLITISVRSYFIKVNFFKWK